MCWGCFCISMKGRVHVLSSTPCPLLRSVTLISQTADQSELNWERVREVPLYGQRIYMKRGCLSRLCVIVPWVHDTARFLWLVVWPRVSLWLENRRWHTQRHSWFPPMWYVYQQARSGIPFHQNKSQLSDRATFDNVTLLLPTCTFQLTLIRHSPPFTSPQNPFHPFFTSSSAVFHLDVSGLDSDIDHCCRLRASSPSCDKSFPDSQML